MNFDNDNNFMSNESIFQNVEAYNAMSSQMMNASNIDYESLNNNGLLSKLVNKINDKLDEFTDKDKKEQKKLEKIVENFINEDGDFLQIMSQFGCVLVVQENGIEIQCEQFDLTGKITLKENSKTEYELDENAKKILYIISKVLDNLDHIDGSMDKNEEEGFYPVGELEKKTITVKGEEKEVFAGTLMNEKGETKQIYFLNGREVQPD